MTLYIALMSGTSMDGIDAVLADIDDSGRCRLVATHSHAWPAELQQQLRQLALPGDNEIDRMGEADARIGELFAVAVQSLLHKAATTAEAVAAIGSHGQTISHRPDDAHPFTLQIGDPNRLAAVTGITTVADFRRRDMAVGGQGAPLAPAFHKAVFGSAGENRAILNIGGIANLTRLPADPAEAVSGFDTGPGNRLLDDWIAHIRGETYDRDGAWAARGEVIPELLEGLLEDPWFDQPPPKSTGTERFNLGWLGEKLDTLAKTLKPEDIQATLLELTAVTIADAVRAFCPGTERLLT